MQAVSLAAIALIITGTYLAISPLLGYAGIEDSLQDLATHHFRDPDVADPIGLLLRSDRALLVAAPGMLAAAILPVVASVIGIGGLIQRRTVEAAMWAAAGAASLVLVLLHPITAEIPRLVAPLWLSAALGYGGILTVGWRHLRAERRDGHRTTGPVGRWTRPSGRRSAGCASALPPPGRSRGKPTGHP